MANNVARVCPMPAQPSPSTSLGVSTSSGPVLSSLASIMNAPTQPSQFYQSINVNVNGVLKSVLIPVTLPVTAPVAVPVTSSVAVPITASVAVPVTAPIAVPVTAPVAAPVAASVIVPVPSITESSPASPQYRIIRSQTSVTVPATVGKPAATTGKPAANSLPVLVCPSRVQERFPVAVPRSLPNNTKTLAANIGSLAGNVQSAGSLLAVSANALASTRLTTPLRLAPVPTSASTSQLKTLNSTGAMTAKTVRYVQVSDNIIPNKSLMLTPDSPLTPSSVRQVLSSAVTKPSTTRTTVGLRPVASIPGANGKLILGSDGNLYLQLCDPPTTTSQKPTPQVRPSLKLAGCVQAPRRVGPGVLPLRSVLGHQEKIVKFTRCKPRLVIPDGSPGSSPVTPLVIAPDDSSADCSSTVTVSPSSPTTSEPETGSFKIDSVFSLCKSANSDEVPANVIEISPIDDTSLLSETPRTPLPLAPSPNANKMMGGSGSSSAEPAAVDAVSGFQEADDSATPEADDSATQEADDSAIQEADDSATQEADDSAIQEADDSAIQEADDSAIQEADDIVRSMFQKTPPKPIQPQQPTAKRTTFRSILPAGGIRPQTLKTWSLQHPSAAPGKVAMVAVYPGSQGNPQQVVRTNGMDPKSASSPTMVPLKRKRDPQDDAVNSLPAKKPLSFRGSQDIPTKNCHVALEKYPLPANVTVNVKDIASMWTDCPRCPLAQKKRTKTTSLNLRELLKESQPQQPNIGKMFKIRDASGKPTYFDIREHPEMMKTLTHAGTGKFLLVKTKSGSFLVPPGQSDSVIRAALASGKTGTGVDGMGFKLELSKSASSTVSQSQAVHDASIGTPGYDASIGTPVHDASINTQAHGDSVSTLAHDAALRLPAVLDTVASSTEDDEEAPVAGGIQDTRDSCSSATQSGSDEPKSVRIMRLKSMLRQQEAQLDKLRKERAGLKRETESL